MSDGIIRNYISREIIRDRAVALDNETPLLEEGILDSLALLRLVVFIQEQFGIVVEDVEIVPENFASVEAISRYIDSRGDRASRLGAT